MTTSMIARLVSAMTSREAASPSAISPAADATASNSFAKPSQWSRSASVASPRSRSFRRSMALAASRRSSGRSFLKARSFEAASSQRSSFASAQGRPYFSISLVILSVRSTAIA